MLEFEITQFSKAGGPLTKTIRLNGDGTAHSDASDCMMARGAARRLRLSCIGELATAVETFEPRHALSLGRLRAGLPDQVRVTTKDNLNGREIPDLIDRTGANLVFEHGAPAFALLDFDKKGMPADVAARLIELGGFEPALSIVLPDLAKTARMFRASTSAGLYRSDTGDRLPTSGGEHGYCVVRDGGDIERFLSALHDRCWLAGLGWYIVGKAGQLLNRSIVDRVVGTPERLVFEGPPVLVQPLAQDLERRKPIVRDGGILDTVATCPPLTIVEKSRLTELQARAAQQLQGEVGRVREQYVREQSELLARRTGTTVEAARRVVEQQTRGTLLPDVVLHFTNLGEHTVFEVLTDPDQYVGEWLADPIEGVDYGRATAIVNRRSNGTMWIYSHAHGRTDYDLRIDLAMAATMLEKAEPKDAARLFVRLVIEANLDPVDTLALRDLAVKRGGISVNALKALLKAGQDEHKRDRVEAEKRRRAAERRDPRPVLDVPPYEAELTPVVELLDETLGACALPVPPMRSEEQRALHLFARKFLSLHTLSSQEENDDK